MKKKSSVFSFWLVQACLRYIHQNSMVIEKNGLSGGL